MSQTIVGWSCRPWDWFSLTCDWSGHLYDHFNDFGWREVFGAPNTSTRPVGILSVGDWSPMVFSGLRSIFYAQRLSYNGFQYTNPDTGGKTTPWPVGDQSPTGGWQLVQIGGIAKTCRRTVGDWSSMGGDLRAMILPSDCGPLVVRLVLD